MEVGYIMDTWMTPWGSTTMVPLMDRRPPPVPLAWGCSQPSCTPTTRSKGHERERAHVVDTRLGHGGGRVSVQRP